MRADHDTWLQNAQLTTGLPDGLRDTVQDAHNAFAEPWQLDPRTDHRTVEAAFQRAVHRLDTVVVAICVQLK